MLGFRKCAGKGGMLGWGGVWGMEGVGYSTVKSGCREDEG